jgi:hypothetical protein
MKFSLGYIIAIAGRRTEVLEPGPMVTFMFVVLALGLIGLGYFYAQRRKQWLSHSLITQGTVVFVSKRYTRGDVSGMHPIYFPTVTYLAGGQQFKIEATQGTDNITEVGQQMEVRYNPETPSESALGSNNIPGVKPTIFYVLGIVSVLISTLLIM